MSGRTLSTALTITVPAPRPGATAPFISANARMHWAPKGALTREWRKAAAYASRAATRGTYEQRVHIVATIHRGHNRGRWDVANLSPTLKACVDGLVDAGLIADDSNRHVVGPDLRPGDARPGEPCVVLTITPTGLLA